MQDTNDRLEGIETQLAFQEDALEQFNAVVVSQQGQIDELRAQLRILQEQLSALPTVRLSPRSILPGKNRHIIDPRPSADQ